ncbi:flavodoxin family protein [Hujiaoplasma nucleasis]|uniref:Flavodoxin family protein n=1 Tax=Hujiaoplasma nucleasis TaxID=2725268 RepID=A0A7L6N3R3_9MOLU|nr:hypothetical protein [Hujiaoplasma nucleasis]QLY39877.1 flavodoxin family protein [Hujiaoplasma nucleasis]
MESMIVYYSKTQNTESVVKRFDIQAKMIKAQSQDPNQKHIVLLEKPDIRNVDHIIFACPVHGFQACRIMKAYLESLDDLRGKTIDLFVTHHFRFAWLGGIQALKQMRQIIHKKNGVVRHERSINWKSHKRESDIQEMIQLFQKE